MAINPSDVVNAYANAGRIGSGAGLGARDGVGGQSFGDLLRQAAEGTVDTLKQGEQSSLQAVTGKADLAAVTAAVNNAEVALQTVVAVRDRVVQAYQDIMRMPI